MAATFGAGLGYACVVDVGDQKTSVSCVEDGISHPNTRFDYPFFILCTSFLINTKNVSEQFRVRLEYGGGDVTQTLHWLLQKCAFPYKECDEKMPQDAMLLKSLKEEFCHVNLVGFPSNVIATPLTEPFLGHMWLTREIIQNQPTGKISSRLYSTSG